MSKKDKITGNKGEWGEFYTLLKLADEERVYEANADLKKKDVYYPIREILREGSGGIKRYLLYKHEDKIEIEDVDGNKLKIVDKERVGEGVKRVLKGIKEGSGGSFHVAEAIPYMNELLCEGIKAGSDKKQDIILVIHDVNTRTETEVGFSIKTLLGSNSTLFNPSESSNLEYKIEGDLSDEEIDTINRMSGPKSKIQEIFNKGCSLKFREVPSKAFEYNLRLVDSLLPEILAELLVEFYSMRGGDVPDVVTGADLSFFQDVYDLDKNAIVYKIKNFLFATSLGMTSAERWSGILQATGGFLIVRQDGEVVCYHVYNIEQFRDYLFDYTRFDGASSTRYKYGNIYKKAGEKRIRLNTQIRFKQ